MAPNKRKILEAARKFAQKGQKPRALKEYERLLKLDPRDAKLRLEIGDAHRRWGQVEEAISAYTRVAEQYMNEGFDARAVAVFKQIQNLDPKRYDSYIPLAELYQRMGLNSEAIQALQTAADGYHREGKKREALELLRKMAQLDSSNTTSRIKVADLLRQEGLAEEAVLEYEAAHEELERQGEREAAGHVLERILEVEPKRYSALLAMGKNLVAQGRADQAEPVARRAQQLKSSATEPLELLAEVYQTLRRDRELAATYRELAEHYRQRGDEDKARALLQRLDPNALAEGLDADALLQADDAAPDPDAGAFEEPSDASFGSLPAEGFEGLAGEGFELEPDPASEPDAGSEAVLELETELPAMPETAADEPAPVGDSEQLLAEASVYLRYGKADRAVRNLKAVLAREPEHRAALEKLGEAQAERDAPADAVQAWQRAAVLALSEGDETAARVLRDRIAGLDPDAAAALAVPEPVAVAPAAAELPEEDAAGDLTLEDVELELEPDALEVGLDDDFADLEEELPPEDAAAMGAGLSGELEVELPELPPAAPVDGVAAPESEADAPAPERISEDVEEAEFYRQQGLLDEAEAVYRRVLEGAPEHPLALARLQEIEAERTPEPIAAIDPAETLGDARGDSSAETTAQDPLPGEWNDEGLDEVEIEIEEPEGLGEPVALEGAPEPALAPAEPDEELDAELQIAEAPGAEREEPAEATPLAAEPDTDLDRELLIEEASGEPEEASFDLAAELSEIFDGEADDPRGASGPSDDGFRAVFQAFKRGVEDTLGADDHEAHYDLGIAYREMGLLDDAATEFERAARSDARRVDGLHMLGLCQLDGNQAGAAVETLQRALGAGSLSEEQALALRFDLGRAYRTQGEIEKACDAWQAVAAVDPSFCEVGELLQELAGEAGGAPVEAEEFESFADLFDEDAEPASDAQPDPEPEPDPGKQRRRRKISFF